MPTPLLVLPEGTRFRLSGMPEVTGELVRVSDCSTTVKIDGGKQDVTIEDDEGVVRRFTANKSRTTTWAPATLVDPIFIPEVGSLPVSETKEIAMSKKTAKPASTTTVPGGSGKQKTKAPKAPKAEKPAGDATDKTAKAKAATKADERAIVLAKINERGGPQAFKKRPKAPKEPKARKVSALDAAAQILKAKPGHAMKCPDLIAEAGTFVAA